MTDNLSQALLKTALFAADAQHIASLTVSTLRGIRTDEAWEAFYESVLSLQQELNVDDAVLPQKRKVPK